MERIGLSVRCGSKIKWAGDLKALHVIQKGMRARGIQADLIDNPSYFSRYDHLFFSNTCLDLRPELAVARLHNVAFSVIPFYEDSLKYVPFRDAFFRWFLEGALDPFSPPCFNPDLETKEKMNREVLEEAVVCIANSPTEAKVLQRDVPLCNAKTVFWTSGFMEKKERPTQDFLKFAGLSSGSYILQVGRFEARKNQLATILASASFDIPLVFISTMTPYLDYEEACLRAILRLRKAPTYVISQMIPSMRSGPLTILQMPQGKILSPTLLRSAFGHAGLHLHPAFHELPGYTYLESVKLGIPTIASSWATVADYLTGIEEGRIEYALPYDIKRISFLIEKMWGKKFSRYPSIPLLYRTPEDVASEILEHIPGF